MAAGPFSFTGSSSGSSNPAGSGVPSASPLWPESGAGGSGAISSNSSDSFRRQELGGVQQRPAQRWIVAGPGTFRFASALKLRPHGLHLRIEIVEIVQHERFREHGQLGRAEIVLAVVADDEVLDQRLQ